MVPYISKGDLTLLTPKRQKKICSCFKTCQHFYSIALDSDDIILCERDAKEFAFQMLEKTDLVNERREFIKSQFGWTEDQERFLIQYLQNPDCYDGKGKVRLKTYNIIGEQIGKSNKAIKGKVQYLRKVGRL